MITSYDIRQRIKLCLFGLVVFMLNSCDQRFANAPIFEAGNRPVTISKELLAGTVNTKTFELEDAIQYLRFHETQNWQDLSAKEINKWSELYNQSAEVLELVSDYYRTNDDLEKALHFNQLAEEKGAAGVDFYKKRAYLYKALGEYELAIDYINKAVRINGSDPDTYLTKGKVYLSMGDSLSALSNMQRAFANDSTRLDIGVDLAHLFVKAGQDLNAKMMIDYLVAQDYMSTALTHLLVRLYRRKGQDEDANRLLRNLLNNGGTAAGVSLVNYFREQNLLDSMILYSTTVLEQDTANLSAMEAKAYSFDRKGYYTSALIYYNQMLAIDSLNEEALEGIRKVNGKIAYLRKLREQKEAIPTFDFAAPIKRNNNIDE